ncbi:hypothetical protein CTheo_9083 [Ceratobasidium theobromae]|uniref:HAT C-terminal dimerisation domain-containing protein n=1 Tax=Ceratobasidium theobromae TaxID=1582974 RepID=A0A5N5Q7V8_9AGAM|nr:hypothetical protein CTheo_9083 [Ceratobasidium theobromae]
MPLMGTPCAACLDPGVICALHPTDTHPQFNPFYHPVQHVQRGYPNPNPPSITSMLQYLEARGCCSAAICPEDLSTKTSQAQGRGVNNLFIDSEGCIYDDEFGVTPPQSPEAPIRIQPTPQRPPLGMIAASPYSSSPSRVISLHQKLIVDAEHERYVKEKLLPLSDLGKTDLVKHWTSLDDRFSLLHAMSMDVLPAQASSVSSERVFSSSKLSCTRARNKMKTDTVEALQILKYSLRNRYRKSTTISSASHGPTTEQQSPEEENIGDVQTSLTLDLMTCLCDTGWGHDAILDADLDKSS